MCSGVYIVTVSDSVGHVINDTVNITAYPVPHPVLTHTDTAICDGHSAKICVTQAFARYLWFSADGDTTSCFYPVSYGADTVQVTHANGCTATATATVAVYYPDTFSIERSTKAICNGDSVQLCATGEYPHYLWNTSDTTYCIEVRTPGVYKLQVTNSEGCVAVDSAMVHAFSIDSPIVTSNKTDICPGDSAQLCVTQAFAHYLWNTYGSMACTTAYSAGNYTVQVSDTNGCSETGSATVSALSADSAEIMANKTFMCAGDSARLCVSPLPDSPAYQWNTGAATQCIYGISSGNYFITVTNHYGCTSESNVISLSVCSSIPEIAIEEEGDTIYLGNISGLGSCFVMMAYRNDTPVTSLTAM